MHELNVAGPSGAPSVLFIHGAGGDHTVWAPLVARLHGKRNLVAIDLPGHGRSERIPDLTIEGYTRAVAARVRSLAAAGAAPLYLVGNSMGGAIALLTALEHPEGVDGIVLIGSGAKLGVSPRILEMLERDPVGSLRIVIEFAFAPGTAPEVIAKGAKFLALCPPDVFASDFKSCSRFDVRDRLVELKSRLLVLCGDNDRLTPPKFSEWLAQAVPDTTLRILPGAGHLAMIDQPDAVAEEILAFTEQPG